jgi:hypothetical protein
LREVEEETPSTPETSMPEDGLADPIARVRSADQSLSSCTAVQN